LGEKIVSCHVAIFFQKFQKKFGQVIFKKEKFQKLQQTATSKEFFANFSKSSHRNSF